MDSIMRMINVIYRCGMQYRSEKLEQYGLNGCQPPYILNICRQPGISQDGLAKRLYVNKSSVTRQLAVLEQNGFIERKNSDADRRTVCVYPTPKALKVYPVVCSVLSEWNRYLTEELSPEEQQQFASLLSRLMDQAAAYTEKGDRL